MSQPVVSRLLCSLSTSNVSGFSTVPSARETVPYCYVSSGCVLASEHSLAVGTGEHSALLVHNLDVSFQLTLFLETNTTYWSVPAGRNFGHFMSLFFS